MFNINGITWYIKFVHPADEIFTMDNGLHTIGVCEKETQTIYLSTSLRGHLLKKVLCHEVVHAAMFSYDIQLDINQEELVADLLSTYGEEIINKTNEVFKRLQ